MTIQTPEKLSSTMEDYLETIFALVKERGVARVGEIAAKLNVKSPTVNSAIKSLTEKGLIDSEKYGYIRLTSSGERLASEVQSKHDILYRFLTEFLMLKNDQAAKEACCIEHAISKKTFQRLTKFFKFLETGFKGERPNFLKNFENYLKTGKIQTCDKTSS